MVCLTCRGKGLAGGCPACGKTFDVETPSVIDVPKEKLDLVQIPDYYKDKVWSKQVFLNTHRDFKSQMLLEKYAETLNRIYDIFSCGRIPNKSFIVIASRGMGKLTWAYSCIRESLNHGFTAMPIIDNTQFKRLNILSSDRMNSPYLKTMSYSIEQYLAADVVFVEIDPDNFQASYRTLDSILSKRARMGLSTFILSRYTIEQLSWADYSNTFSEVVARQQQDWNKYLTVIGGLT